MRTAYGAHLATLVHHLAEMCRMAGTAMERATRALLGADLALAEQVIGDYEAIIEARARTEEVGFGLLALHAPVARDLRATVSSIQIVADLERMGALALHIAETARRRHPHHALPKRVRNHFAEMGRVAVDLGDNARQVILSCDLGRARYIRDADDAMDDLHRHLFTVMTDREWTYGTTAAVDVTLLSRYYERYADHAVEISRRIIFQATGQVPTEDRITTSKCVPRTKGLTRAAFG